MGNTEFLITDYLSERNKALTDCEIQIMQSTGIKVKCVAIRYESLDLDPIEMLDVAAKALGFEYTDYARSSRERIYTDLRKIGYVLMREIFGKRLGMLEMARLFNQGDHTTAKQALETGIGLLAAKDMVFTSKYNRALKAVTEWLERTYQ